MCRNWRRCNGVSNSRTVKTASERRRRANKAVEAATDSGEMQVAYERLNVAEMALRAVRLKASMVHEGVRPEFADRLVAFEYPTVADPEGTPSLRPIMSSHRDGRKRAADLRLMMFTAQNHKELEAAEARIYGSGLSEKTIDRLRREGEAKRDVLNEDAAKADAVAEAKANR